MDSMVKRLNQSLTVIFNPTDTIYKALIADVDGVPADTITTPVDYNIGATANLLKYVLDIYTRLKNQLILTEMNEEFATYTLTKYFGSTRYEDETIEHWVTRVINSIFTPHGSQQSLEQLLIPAYCAKIEFLFTDNLAMYADYSYADMEEYRDAKQDEPPITPALPYTEKETLFLIIIKVYAVKGSTEEEKEANKIKIEQIINNYGILGLCYVVWKDE